MYVIHAPCYTYKNHFALVCQSVYNAPFRLTFLRWRILSYISTWEAFITITGSTVATGKNASVRNITDLQAQKKKSIFGKQRV